MLSTSSGLSKSLIFFTDLPNNCFSELICSLAEYFSLINPSILWAYSNENLEILLDLDKKSNFLFSHISFSNKLSSSEVSRMISKVIKPQGIQHFIFLPDPNFCEILLNGFSSSHLENQGNIAIFFTTCLYQVSLNGSIILSYEGFEHIRNAEEYKIMQITKFLKHFLINGKSIEQISKELMSTFDNECKFSIINYQNNTREIIGSVVNGNVQISEKIEFLVGVGVKDIRNYTSPSIVISANTGSFNPSGAERTYSNEGYQQGTYFAVKKINKDHKLFTNYIFQLYDKVDCGVSIFDSNYSKNCLFYHRPNMGVVYIPTAFSFTLSALKLFESNNMNLPFIGGIGSSGYLSNKTEFPYFVRTVSPSAELAVAWANLI